MFGSTSPFGATSASPFGAPAATNPFGANPNPFGTNPQASNPFGAKPFGSTTPAFGAQPGNSVFGSGTSTGVFGATATTAFGASASFSAFGASSLSPAFGAFGQQKPASPFGGFGATQPQQNPFGSQPFGSTAPGFGAQSAPAFGSTTTPLFGASGPAFGATSTPAFGASASPGFGAASAPAFGASTSTPAFGASAPAFGGSSTGAFGSTPAASPFGASSGSAFGSSFGEAAFGGGQQEHQRHVKCESLQERQVGSVEEKTSFVSRLEGGAEDTRQSGGNDDGLARAKLAVFVSGGGSNLRAIHAGCKKNAVHGDVAYVVSDKPGCKGVEYAVENNIPVLAYPKGKNAPEGISPTELVENLRLAGVEYILLAGYLRLLPSELVHAYPRAILNIHPALLPSFGGKGYFGMKVHEAVIRSGARYTGATVHFVYEKYDTGPILAQRVVPVRVDDTPSELASRVLKEEHKLYSFAVSALCEDRIFWREDGVPIIRKSWDEAEYL